MSASFSRLAIEVNQLITLGKINAAQKALSALTKMKIDRKDLQPAATLARRADLPELALRILNPVLHPSHKKPEVASDEEITEYAACLTKVGGITEAIILLGKVDSLRVPESLKIEAFCHFSHWDYERAIPVLKRYVQMAAIDDYQRTVGMVNLAAACVYERLFPETSDLLENLRRLTEEKRYSLLFANTLELSAQNAIHQKKWDEADKFLTQAENLSEHESGLDAFYIRKWRAIWKLLTIPPSRQSRESLDKIKTEAAQIRRYETIRDCDRFLAIATRDKELFLKLFFGTPYTGFRKWLIHDFGEPSISIPESYLRVFPGKSKLTKVLDISSLPLGNNSGLKCGDLRHRLLTVLASDFYQRFRVPCLHSHLYPGDYYNLETSPNRVHRVMERLRYYLREAKLPLVVNHEAGDFWLDSSDTVAVRIFHPSAALEKGFFASRKLRKVWPLKSFSAAQASTVLALSKRSVQRILRSAVEGGEIEKNGRGSETRYRFSTK